MYDKLAQILLPVASRHGEVLYSAAKYLRPSEIYLLGYNPGQGGPNTSIGEHLKYSLKRTDNAWLDENWAGGTHPSVLQRRMRKLFEDAEQDLRSTPSSNLIFATSKDATGVDYRYTDICWPAHQLIMEIVQPSKLIVFGNGEYESPFAFIKSRYPGNEDRVKVRVGYILKRLTTVIDNRPTEVIGIPHLSRFTPMEKTVEWLR